MFAVFVIHTVPSFSVSASDESIYLPVLHIWQGMGPVIVALQSEWQKTEQMKCCLPPALLPTVALWLSQCLTLVLESMFNPRTASCIIQHSLSS